MATEVGVAYVSIVPSARGFAKTLGAQVNSPIQKQGVASGKKFGGALRTGFTSVGAGLGILALGSIVKDSVGLEASFSQTMNTLAAVTKTPQAGIKALSDLALKFGQDTIFSAGEAATAMLELAKGGITTAQIRGGALSETLTLAAASGTDLATSATILSNAMNTFGLSAKDAPKITAALAGGANASTASIGSLGEALQQVGPGAKNAGLSVQETVAALAAFDNAGIKGSDAGTSLKTMLARLVPQTTKARAVMKAYGLTFTDAQGQFLPLTKIAGNLKKAFHGLSEEQRTSDINKLFGSDASRAALVLADQGTKGLQKFIKATKDQGAAQRVAAARMAGTAGALEQLKGSIETAKLKFGKFIQPAVITFAKKLTDILNGQSPAFNTAVEAMKPFARILATVAGVVKKIPGPMLATFGAMFLAGRAANIAAPKIGSMASSFKTSRTQGTLFKDSLKKTTGFLGGPWGAAFVIGAGVFGHFLAKQAAAKARIEGLTATLDEQTGAVTKNSRAFVVNNLEKSGALAAASKLGLSLRDVTDAALGDKDAKARIDAILAAKSKAGLPTQANLDRTARASGVARLSAAQRDLARNVNIVTGALGRQNTELREARRAARRTAEAMGALANARGAAIAGLAETLRKNGVPLATARGAAGKLFANDALNGGGSTTIVVNNPKPEPASESVDKTLRRKKHRQGVKPS